MRLLVYSQDGMGLGHLRRTRNIARELLSLDADARVLTIADSPVAPFFPALDRVEHVKLPTIVKTGPFDWRPSAPPHDIVEAIERRAGLVLDAYRGFRPDAVLVDHMPVGALGELRPLLDAAHGETHLILGLRDVLDEPATLREVWGEQGAYDYLPRYEQVLVYGCRDIYDTAAAYGLASKAGSVEYCHYVAPRRDGDVSRPDGGRPSVLVMGGGGADAFPLARAFLDAFPALQRALDLEALVLTGPNMPVEDREMLQQLAAGYPVRVEASVEDATACLRDASAVVTMGGYNSLCEVIQWRRRALVVPRRAPSAEQRMRSRLFAERGLVRLLEPEQLDPKRLASELLGLLHEDGIPQEANVPPLDGAARAARLLLATAGRGTGVAVEEMIGGG